MPRGVYARTTNGTTAVPPVASVPDVLVNTLLKGIKINVHIPENATLAQVEETLEIGIERYRDLKEAQEQLMPIIGRILYEVRERKLFRPGHKNFTGWLKSFGGRVKMAPST